MTYKKFSKRDSTYFSPFDPKKVRWDLLPLILSILTPTILSENTVTNFSIIRVRRYTEDITDKKIINVGLFTKLEFAPAPPDYGYSFGLIKRTSFYAFKLKNIHVDYFDTTTNSANSNDSVSSGIRKAKLKSFLDRLKTEQIKFSDFFIAASSSPETKLQNPSLILFSTLLVPAHGSTTNSKAQEDWAIKKEINKRIISNLMEHNIFQFNIYNRLFSSGLGDGISLVALYHENQKTYEYNEEYAFHYSLNYDKIENESQIKSGVYPVSLKLNTNKEVKLFEYSESSNSRGSLLPQLFDKIKYKTDNENLTYKNFGGNRGVLSIPKTVKTENSILIDSWENYSEISKQGDWETFGPHFSKTLGEILKTETFKEKAISASNKSGFVYAVLVSQDLDSFEGYYQEQEVSGDSTSSSSKKKGWAIALIIFVVLALIGVGFIVSYFYLRKDKGGVDNSYL